MSDIAGTTLNCPILADPQSGRTQPVHPVLGNFTHFGLTSQSELVSSSSDAHHVPQPAHLKVDCELLAAVSWQHTANLKCGLAADCGFGSFHNVTLRRRTMSRKFFGLLALAGMVLMVAGFSTQSKEAEAGFLFFGHGGSSCCCVDYDDDDCGHDDDDCGHDDDDCCAPVCCRPAPVACCAPAPTCCAPAPTCCGAAPAYENGGGAEGAAPAPPAEAAPAPAAEKAPAPAAEKTDA